MDETVGRSPSFVTNLNGKDGRCLKLGCVSNTQSFMLQMLKYFVASDENKSATNSLNIEREHSGLVVLVFNCLQHSFMIILGGWFGFTNSGSLWVHTARGRIDQICPWI
jgi:hypothetical protein